MTARERERPSSPGREGWNARARTIRQNSWLSVTDTQGQRSRTGGDGRCHVSLCTEQTEMVCGWPFQNQCLASSWLEDLSSAPQPHPPECDCTTGEVLEGKVLHFSATSCQSAADR